MALGLALASGLSLTPFNATADFEISAGIHINDRADFYAPLAAEGSWLEVGHYGRCWHPRHVAADWRPYCNGSWVWTDCGWYWESDEPWAWACYHYGAWVYDAEYGWLWVPGVEWAPAWVTWRIGGDYIGWAPCAPSGGAPPPSEFVFVNQSRFEGRLEPSDVIIANPTILNHTTVINASGIQTRNIAGWEQRVIVNKGPDPGVIEKASGKRIHAVSIQEAERHTTAPAVIRSRAGNASEKKTPPALPEQPKFTPRSEEPNFSPRREEQPKSAPERQTPPVVRNLPGRPAPAERNLPPEKHETIPPPKPATPPPANNRGQDQEKQVHQ